jgi:starvation-inducible DNA-binding protein
MLKDSLKTLLADVVTFYFQAHGCHWNIEGADFSEYHALFESIYEDVYSSIDPIAENLRKLGEYVPFGLDSFANEATIEFGPVAPVAKNMANYLLEANEKVIVSVNAAFQDATKENEQGICNFLADRDDKHKFWRWQLRSSVK